VLTAAVEISESVQQGLDDLIGFLPRLIGFLLILLVGYLIAKALQKVITMGLEKVGTDRAVMSGASGTYVERVMPDASPSRLIGRVVFWFVLLGALSIAITSLGINALNDFLTDVFGYLPNIVAAILIFVVASALAAWLGRTASTILGDSPTGKLAATALPVLVMAIAVFMILNQLKIATDIVVITYAALMGAVALGMALAFGLGGRDVASRMLEDAYRSGQEARAQYRGKTYQRSPGPTAVRADAERRPAST
jgi:Conserved TM helix